MSWNPYSQNSSGTPNNPYTPGGYEKQKLRKLLVIAIAILAAIALIILVVHLLPESQQSKYAKSAAAAASKQHPNAKAANVKVADGFALARITAPTLVKDGATTLFKVNKDGSMTQLASGSSFNQIYLLGLGIPLATQAKLTGSNIAQVKQALANTCNYSGGSAPGFSGFEGSFNPDGWQISATSLDGLEQALTTVISHKNTGLTSDKTIVCVNATQNGSSKTIDTNTYVSTFTLPLQFITGDGTLTKHTFTFVVEPKNHRSYTLDGQNIQ